MAAIFSRIIVDLCIFFLIEELVSVARLFFSSFWLFLSASDNEVVYTCRVP